MQSRRKKKHNMDTDKQYQLDKWVVSFPGYSQILSCSFSTAVEKLQAKCLLSTQSSLLSAFMISKTHVIAQKLRERQLCKSVR